MSQLLDPKGLPIITDVTRAQSENIETILSRMRSGRVIVPDYQRDAEQWNDRKESLLIETVLNNLTMPAFFFAENAETGVIEVVDGQQRLSTIRKFADNELTLGDDESVDYLTPQSIHYSGKRFMDLHPRLQNVFSDYPLTIIYLPRAIKDLSTKLEIFRRINEGGTPLSPQDIRLAYYSDSPSVTFIRLAGLYSNSKAATRMVEAATKRGVVNPWEKCPEVRQLWCEWWQEKAQARGQTPSEMFLWYLVARQRNALNTLLSTPNQSKHLPISFRGSTEEALDIYCAQLRWSDEHNGVRVFPTYSDGLVDAFDDFARWIHELLSRGLPGISVDKYKQAALFIAATTELALDPKTISHNAWDAFAEFIRTPRKAGRKWLKNGGYPEQRGRWGGNKGQKVQCDRVIELVESIMNE